MQTNLPKTITTVEEAKAFLTELHTNGEHYHPEDSALDVIWTEITGATIPVIAEQKQLDKLMSDIYMLPGNDGRHHGDIVFDPCEFLNSLDATYEALSQTLAGTPEQDEEDDRIFTAEDMYAFAIQMSRYAISHKFNTMSEYDKYVANELRYREGDGSYETYTMPIR